MKVPAIPVRVFWREGRPQVDLALFEGPVTDPFFDDTITLAFARPIAHLLREERPLEELEPSPPDSLPIRGFIFHMSRCGSTAVSQMLASLPDLLVISEPSCLDALLDPGLYGGTGRDAQITALRTLVANLCRQRSPAQSGAILKLAPWHVLHLPLWLAAFPAVPWVFAYRDPKVVLAANMERTGGYFLPGALPPELTGLDLQPSQLSAPEVSMGRLLAQMMAAPVPYLGQGGLLLNYEQLPGAVRTLVGPHFGIPIDAAAWHRMQDVANRDAKNPAVLFRDDSAAKLRRASPVTLGAADQFAVGPYGRLETLRLAGGK